MVVNKPKVAILGVTGMVGSSIYQTLQDKYDLVLVCRNKEKLNLLDQRYGGVGQHSIYQLDVNNIYREYLRDTAKGALLSPTLTKLVNELSTCDWVINALAIITPYCEIDPGLTFFINSAFPHLLAETLGPKLIHMTTDCVFSGSTGAPYDEVAPKLPPDIYGLSKALGEPQKALVMRTSFIGLELTGNRSLLAWLISQRGRTINGYTNHWWNGITALEFGHICQKIIDREIMPEPGIYHVFSEDITKHDLLVKLNQKFNLGCTINPVAAPLAIDRRLRTIKNLNQQLQIPSLDAMIAELASSQNI
ncbi:MAG: sugar nucleotide-binding protein [Patescibacteria group bacterium]|jgi:dTDP-4-dehydrorhamnose reductase